MAYLRDYEYDVFVSYSLANDDERLDGKPWVEALVARLKSRLRNLLPDNGKDVDFYYARKTLEYGDSLASCRDQARRSALFLIIGSPRYLDAWPASELRAFCEEPGASRRILVAELFPLHAGQSYPNPVGDDIFRAPFWALTGRGSPAPRRADEREFDETFSDFANALCGHLTELRERTEAPAAERKPNPGFPPVLLARVTDDLEPQRRRLRSYLEQFELEVLPPPDDFQEEGAEFAAEFEAQLERKPIVVQLLGPYPARRTRALPDGFDGLQDRLVREREDIRLFKWRDRDLDLTTVEDEQHRKLLSGDVQAMDFEDFKDMVKRQATSPPPRPEPKEGKAGGSFLFIDADQIDAETARAVLRECQERKIIAMMPEFGVDTLKDWRANYADADRVALIHRRSDRKWLNAQLKLFVKVSARSRRPQQCLIYLAGPPAKEMDDMTVVHPAFEYVEAPDGDLSPLLTQLG